MNTTKTFCFPRRSFNTTVKWSDTTIAQDETHHIIRLTGVPLYHQRFLSVLPFHEPGLSPVKELSGKWCHISFPSGSSAYEQRFERAFGFYEQLACVVENKAWFHIQIDGKRHFPQVQWSWAGNFQGGMCVVQDEQGKYFHQSRRGCVYGPYIYCGDFREGCAVVRLLDTGLCSHVNEQGKLIHGKLFFELGVFHKGTAVAKDSRGWFCVNKQGIDVLNGKRFLSLEPFYNSHAAATRLDGQRVVIDEQGEVVHILPCGIEGVEDRAHILNLVTSYWPAMVVKCGLELKANSVTFPPVLQAAWKELGLAGTRRGQLLEGELRDVATYWLNHQLSPWLTASSRLSSSLDFFEELSRDNNNVKLMQEVLEYYSHDWVDSAAGAISSHCFSSSSVVDIGGGLGLLVEKLVSKGVSAMLFERPEVAKLAQVKRPHLSLQPGNFFTDNAPRATHYVLSHVLHDWDNDRCIKLLRHLLLRGQKIFIIERLSLAHHAHALLSLNMAVTTGGKERSRVEWTELFSCAGGKLEDCQELPSDRHLFVVSKRLPENPEYGEEKI